VIFLERAGVAALAMGRRMVNVRLKSISAFGRLYVVSFGVITTVWAAAVQAHTAAATNTIRIFIFIKLS
jgi:hypothetical protein